MCIVYCAALLRNKVYIITIVQGSWGFVKQHTAHIKLRNSIIYDVEITENVIIHTDVKCPCNNFIKRHFNQYFVNNNNNNFISSNLRCRSPWITQNSATLHY